MRDMILRTGDIVIPGGRSANVQVICEAGPFLLQKLIVPPEVRPSFLITDIKVGNNSQFLSTGAIPASFFIEENQHEEIRFDVLRRGDHVTLSVINIAVADPAPVPEDVVAILMRRRSWIVRLFGRGRSITPDPPSTTRHVPVDDGSRSFSARLVGLAGNDLPKRTADEGSYVMGLGHTIVPPRGDLVLRVQSQVAFNPRRLVVPAEVLVDLRVKDLRIAGESMMPPGTTFNGRMEFEGPSAQIRDWISIKVRNGSNGERAFCGAIVGTPERPSTRLHQEEQNGGEA